MSWKIFNTQYKNVADKSTKVNSSKFPWNKKTYETIFFKQVLSYRRAQGKHKGKYIDVKSTT